MTLPEVASKIGISGARLLDVAKSVGSYYQPFDIKRAGTKKWRHIDNPTGALKEIQSRIQSRLLGGFPIRPEMFGGVPGRSHLDAASRHLRQQCVVIIDIKGFFPSTSNGRVHRLFRRLGFDPRAARVLTQLTTFQRRLPQGASTSTTIGNLVLGDLCSEVVGLCRSMNVTFFVDDITISGASGSNVRAMVEQVVRLVRKHNYRIGHHKVEIMSAGGSQHVLGVNVNRSRLSAGRGRIRDLRDQLIGKEVAPSPKSLLGRVGYVKSINCHQAAALQRLADRILLSSSSGDDSPVRHGDVIRSCSSIRRKH